MITENKTSKNSNSHPELESPARDSHSALDEKKTMDDKQAGDTDQGDSHGDSQDAHADGHSVPPFPAEGTMGDKFEWGMEKYLDTEHLFAHVQDSDHFELPFRQKLYLPNPLGTTAEKPLVKIGDKPFLIGAPTKFMALELLAAIIIVALFVTLASKIRGGRRATGRLWNMLEVFVVFIRDEIARPAIGSKDANRFLPFLLTLFFFVLGLNLLGMVPTLGSATGSVAVTGVIALVTFLVVVVSGMRKMGVIGFFKNQVPSMDLPGPMAIVLIPMIFLIEMFGFLVKHFVLAIRLFANMFGGHLVMAVMVAFIAVFWEITALAVAVTPVAFLAAVAFGLLELFVAFLQAYVFTFLAALFIGSAQHAH